MIAVRFDRARLSALLKALKADETLASFQASQGPASWVDATSDLLGLAALLLLQATQIRAAFLAGADVSALRSPEPDQSLERLHNERREAVVGTALREVFAAHDWLMGVVAELADGTYTDHYEPVTTAF